MIWEIITLFGLITINLLFGIISYKNKKQNNIKLNFLKLSVPFLLGLILMLVIFYFQKLSDVYLFLFLGMHFGMIYSINLIVGRSAEKRVKKEISEDDHIEHREVPIKGRK